MSTMRDAKGQRAAGFSDRSNTRSGVRQSSSKRSGHDRSSTSRSSRAPQWTQLARFVGNQRVLRAMQVPPGELPQALAREVVQARGSGEPLPEPFRVRVDAASGPGAKPVFLRTDAVADALARALGSRAFTFRDTIFFARGEYRPGTAEGQQVIAHELAHVFQQRRACSGTRIRVGDPESAGEGEARRVADEFAHTSAHGGVPAVRWTADAGEIQRLSIHAPGAGMVTVSPGTQGVASAESGRKAPSPEAVRIVQALMAGTTLDDRASVAKLPAADLEYVQQALQRWLDDHPAMSSWEHQEVADSLWLARATLAHKVLGRFSAAQPLTGLLTSVALGLAAGMDRATDWATVVDDTQASLSTASGVREFGDGALDGIWSGVKRSVVDNAKALLMLGAAGSAMAYAFVLGPALIPAIAIWKPGLLEEVNSALEGAWTEIKDCAIRMAADPAFVFNAGFEWGVSMGLAAGDSVNKEFLAAGAREKGKYIGEIFGYSVAEIAMLFVGPEELLLKGGGHGAALIGRLSGRARKLAESAPALVEAIAAKAGKLRSSLEQPLRELEQVLMDAKCSGWPRETPSPLAEGVGVVDSNLGNRSGAIGQLRKNAVQKKYWEAVEESRRPLEVRSTQPELPTARPVGGKNKASLAEGPEGLGEARKDVEKSARAEGRSGPKNAEQEPEGRLKASAQKAESVATVRTYSEEAAAHETPTEARWGSPEHRALRYSDYMKPEMKKLRRKYGITEKSKSEWRRSYDQLYDNFHKGMKAERQRLTFFGLEKNNRTMKRAPAGKWQGDDFIPDAVLREDGSELAPGEELDPRKAYQLFEIKHRQYLAKEQYNLKAMLEYLEQSPESRLYLVVRAAEDPAGATEISGPLGDMLVRLMDEGRVTVHPFDPALLKKTTKVP